MSFQYQKSDILEKDDKIIGAFFTALVFILASAGMLGFVIQNTTFFSPNGIGGFIVQLLLAFTFLFILGIAANYKGMDVIQDYAFPILKWSYLISMGIFIIFLVIIGFLFLPLGIIALGIAAISLFFFSRYWPFILERLRRAAEWIKIATTIVLNEPGMIVLAFIQSIVIGITIIIEVIVLIAWNAYVETASVGENVSSSIVYGIMFLYLWLSFIVLYFFDGANTAMAYARIQGEDPTVGQGINAASAKLPAIAGFALISAVVTAITRLLFFASYDMRLKSENMGQQIAAMLLSFLASIIQFLYHLISFFTLPSIIIRNNSTMDAMRESAGLFTQTFWDKIIADMGYSYAANILYIVTGFILAVGGFIYGYILAATYIAVEPMVSGIIFAIIALIFGIFISRFFLRPLYTSLVTTMYVYVTEGPDSLKIVSNELKGYLISASKEPKFQKNYRSR